MHPRFPESPRLLTCATLSDVGINVHKEEDVTDQRLIVFMDKAVINDRWDSGESANIGVRRVKQCVDSRHAIYVEAFTVYLMLNTAWKRLMPVTQESLVIVERSRGSWVEIREPEGRKF